MNLFENLQKYKESNEKSEDVKMIIKVLSGLNSDGFDITIKQNNKTIFSEDYRYGYNASYSPSFANDRKPYVKTIIDNLCKQYNVDKNNIEVIAGKNVFRGNDVDQTEVDKFRQKYLSESKIVKEGIYQRKAPSISEYMQKLIPLDRSVYKIYKADVPPVDKQNFMMGIPSYRVWKRDEIDNVKQVLKKVGAKYIRYAYGYIYFYYNETPLLDKQKEDQDKLDQEYQNALQAHQDKMNAIDIDKYKPTEKIIKKLIDYRDRGSKVNIKAIKSVDKLLTYAYGGRLIGWNDLYIDIDDYIPDNYKDIYQAIIERVKNDSQYSDTRSDSIKSLQNLLPKVAKFLRDNNIQYELLNRKPTRMELERDYNNGRMWTMAYTLKINDKEIKFTDHTNEGGGTYGYSGLDIWFGSQTQLSNAIIEYINENLDM